MASPSYAPGTMLGQRYVIVREVAQGGMGAVYEAHDTRLSQRRCALKVLRTAGLTTQEQAEAATWFAREAALLSGLRHALIPTISDYFSDEGQHYLVMDFVDGLTLQDRLARQGAPGLPVAEVVRWGQQLCTVLEYLHTRQPPVIFRDLKPANIMREPGGALKLIDFGIARCLDNTRTGQAIYTMIGTPGYSPPEQYQGLVDPRSDIYSLGATLHHLISGRDPRQHQPFTFPPLRSLIPDIDPALDAAIARAVSLQASARFATAHEFGDALAAKTMTRAPKRVTRPPQPVLQGPPPDPMHPPAPQPPRDVHVTSDHLFWPPVCACCCRSADTVFVVDYVREAGRRSSQTTHRSWRVPYCSRCAHHAVTYHEAAQQVVTRAKVMWIVCTVALCCTLGALLGLVEWAVALLAVAIVVISGMLLARKEKTDARTLMQDTCADVDFPVTYQDCAPVNEFHFRNGAYADMFARANADKLFD